MTEQIHVQVGPDHLLRLGERPPLEAVAQLVWNSLDAEATAVSIEIAQNELGGVQAVRVVDDGHGMTQDEALTVFEPLGNSWKAKSRRSKHGVRMLHGRLGRGRFLAYALGDIVRWVTVSEPPREKTVIRGARTAPHLFEVAEATQTNDPTGTIVEVLNKGDKKLGSLVTIQAADGLAVKFAPYLHANEGVSLTFDGEHVDPSTLVEQRNDHQFEFDGDTVNLVIIEWARPVVGEGTFFLCDAGFTALAEYPLRVQTHGLHLSAYVASEQLSETPSDLGELSEPSLLNEVRPVIRDYVRQRLVESRASLVERWRRERIYPYETAPKTAVEQVEQQVFDLVAITAAEHNALGTNRGTTKLALRLLRVALESGSPMHRILADVLDLPLEQQGQLADLLERTPLTRIIESARIVVTRIDVVAGLEELIYGSGREGVRERDQLHPIVAAHPWLFGDGWTLSHSERSLTRVLQDHLENLGEGAVLEPVTTVEGRKGRLDVVIQRTVAGVDQNERLVVELKRPDTRLTTNELAQIKQYAQALTEDPRARAVESRWDFVLVGHDLDALLLSETRQLNRPSGLVTDTETHRVWVRTWADILADCRARLKFLEEQLLLEPPPEEALERLRRYHEEVLPPRDTPEAETVEAE